MTPGEWHNDDPASAAYAIWACELARCVAEAARPGVQERGSWAFEAVAPFEVEFLIALVAFERDPSDETRLRLRGALCDVVDAWNDFRPLETPQ